MKFSSDIFFSLFWPRRSLFGLFLKFQVICFSYPLTQAIQYQVEGLTTNETYENFLDPMYDNVEYQAKKPGAVK